MEIGARRSPTPRARCATRGAARSCGSSPRLNWNASSLYRYVRDAHGLGVAFHFRIHELAEFRGRAADGIERGGIEKIDDLRQLQRFAHSGLQLPKYGARCFRRREPGVPGEVHDVIRYARFG